jgi:hypothetical protein
MCIRIVFWCILMYFDRNVCVFHMYSRFTTDVPELAPLQQHVKHLKSMKVAGVCLHRLKDLLSYTQNLLLPPTISDLVVPGQGTLVNQHPGTLGTFSVPLQAGAFGVEGVCLTGPQQVQWIQQLAVQHQGGFVIHCDGKHKLHHGKWILITLGTHILRLAAGHLVNTFVPLVYLFTKQHETDGAALYLCKAANVIAMKYCGVNLQPGACMSDHSAAFRNAYVLTWPLAELGQCYPHIIRKYSEGAYCLKTYKNFDEAQLHIRQLHFCPTPEAKTLMIQEVGKVHSTCIFVCYAYIGVYSAVFL